MLLLHELLSSAASYSIPGHSYTILRMLLLGLQLRQPIAVVSALLNHSLAQKATGTTNFRVFSALQFEVS